MVTGSGHRAASPTPRSQEQAPEEDACPDQEATWNHTALQVPRTRQVPPWSSPPHNSPRRRAARPWAPRGPPAVAGAPGQRPPSHWRRRGAQPSLHPSLLGGHLLQSGPGVLHCLETLLPRLPLWPQPPGPADTLRPGAGWAGWGPHPAERGSGTGPRPGARGPPVTGGHQAWGGRRAGTPALWKRMPFGSFSSASSFCSRQKKRRWLHFSDALHTHPPSLQVLAAAQDQA